ncbi:hypothetical protein LIER_12334 [Lithospermum erythrorhizon]|uniref:Uncharacterized protein n=1 Tax=Lithospermum erythrorhizon TaxID=34254 RepID=A0AAV3PWJ3_LITER
MGGIWSFHIPSPPNLEVNGMNDWQTRQFHYHVVKPLLSKQVAAQYKNLRVPYAAFPQSTEHIMRSKGELSAKKTECEELSKTLEEQNQMVEEIRKEKATFVEAKKEKETTLASTAFEAKVARIESSKNTLQDFLNNPSYEVKVGRECDAYLANLATHCKDKLPGLVTLFASEKHNNPTWFEGLSVDTTPPPSMTEGEAVNADEADEEGEVVELPGESRSPPS